MCVLICRSVHLINFFKVMYITEREKRERKVELILWFEGLNQICLHEAWYIRISRYEILNYYVESVVRNLCHV